MRWQFKLTYLRNCTKSLLPCRNLFVIKQKQCPFDMLPLLVYPQRKVTTFKCPTLMDKQPQRWRGKNRVQVFAFPSPAWRGFPVAVHFKALRVIWLNYTQAWTQGSHVKSSCFTSHPYRRKKTLGEENSWRPMQGRTTIKTETVRHSMRRPSLLQLLVVQDGKKKYIVKPYSPELAWTSYEVWILLSAPLRLHLLGTVLWPWHTHLRLLETLTFNNSGYAS